MIVCACSCQGILSTYLLLSLSLSCCFDVIWCIGRERVIRRNLYPGDSLIAFGIVWEYHDDLDWQQFDVRSSSILEDSRNIGDTNIDLQQGNGFNINVNLTSMMMRDSLTNRSSQIRRRKLNVPYTCVSINPQTKLRVSNNHQIKDKYHDGNHWYLLFAKYTLAHPQESGILKVQY